MSCFIFLLGHNILVTELMAGTWRQHVPTKRWYLSNPTSSHHIKEDSNLNPWKRCIMAQTISCQFLTTKIGFNPTVNVVVRQVHHQVPWFCPVNCYSNSAAHFFICQRVVHLTSKWLQYQGTWSCLTSRI